ILLDFQTLNKTNTSMTKRGSLMIQTFLIMKSGLLHDGVIRLLQEEPDIQVVHTEETIDDAKSISIQEKPDIILLFTDLVKMQDVKNIVDLKFLYPTSPFL